MKKISEHGKFKVHLTKHAYERAAQRHVKHNKILAMILWIDEEKLEELKGEDIIVHSEMLNVSLVAQIVKNKVKIITVVPKAHTFVTDVDKIRIELA